jgi:hypothetical protein
MREDTRREKFNEKTMRYAYKFTQTLNMSGNVRISDGWNISFSSGYDFDNHKISMTTASLARDLHCFNMSCSVVLAPYTSYNFTFRCNAATLTDALKYDKRSGYSNASMILSFLYPVESLSLFTFISMLLPRVNEILPLLPLPGAP